MKAPGLGMQRGEHAWPGCCVSLTVIAVMQCTGCAPSLLGQAAFPWGLSGKAFVITNSQACESTHSFLTGNWPPYTSELLITALVMDVI